MHKIMQTGVVWWAAVLALFMALAGCEDSRTPAARQAIIQMETALRDRRGKAAVEYLSERTFPYYDGVIEQARTLTKEQVQALPPGRQYMVLSIRNEMKPEEVKTFSAKQYLQMSISRGYFWHEDDVVSSEDDLAGLELKGDWGKIDEKDASGNSTGAATYVAFEDNFWKVDWSRYEHEIDKSIRRTAEENRMSVEEVILEFLAMDIKEDAKPTVWDPPR